MDIRKIARNAKRLLRKHTKFRNVRSAKISAAGNSYSLTSLSVTEATLTRVYGAADRKVQVMRKLREAELRFLQAFPKTIVIERDRITFHGTLWPHDQPKGTNRTTIYNLVKLGLIEHSYFEPTLCPLRLTEAGRKLIATIRENDTQPAQETSDE